MDTKFRARVQTIHNQGTTYESKTYRWVFYEPMFGMEELPKYDTAIHGQVDLQFTGLKDKKGVEIYEGDVTIDSHKDREIVEWKKYAWILRSFSPKYRGWRYLSDGTLKVIGNIHTNPELLKQNKNKKRLDT